MQFVNHPIPPDPRRYSQLREHAHGHVRSSTSTRGIPFLLGYGKTAQIKHSTRNNSLNCLIYCKYIGFDFGLTSFVNSGGLICNVRHDAQADNPSRARFATYPRRIAGLAGEPRNRVGRHDAPLARWDTGRGSRGNHGPSLRAIDQDADPRPQAAEPALIATLMTYEQRA